MNSCSVIDPEPSTIEIRLAQTMLTAWGDTVQSFSLEPGTAAVLRYSAFNPVTNNLSSNNYPRSGKSVRLGGYFFYGWKDGLLSEEQMEWVATHLDVLSLNTYYVVPGSDYNGGITPEGVNWLKQRNGRLRFYNMMFATTMREPLFDPNTMSDWVLKGVNGKELLGVRRDNDLHENHLMDLGNSEYAEFMRKFIIEHTEKYHADGVAIDEIMWNGYWGLDILELRDYTSLEQVKQSCYNWLERIKRDNPKEVIHQAFWPEAQEHTDGIWGEGAFYSWFRAGTDYTVFYHNMNYEQILESIRLVSDKKQTYIWGAWYDKDNREQLEYSIATYLLGNNSDHVVFHPQPFYDGGYPYNLAGYDINACIEEYEKNKSIFDVELGEPLGEHSVLQVGRSKIWLRRFANGLVYVNPN